MKKTRPAARATQDPGKEAVADYFGKLASDSRKALRTLHAVIRSAAPGSEEGLSYGVPAFRMDGRPLVCYGAFREHCGLFPMSDAVMRRFRRDLEGCQTSKGAIRFPTGERLPVTLIRKIVKARIEEVRRKRR